MTYKIIVPPHIESIIQTLPPALKKKIRSAFDAIKENPYIGKALKEDLRGYRSYRTAYYRIIYEIRHHKIEIQIVALGPRDSVYGMMAAILKSRG